MARLLVFRGDLVDREIDLGVTSIRIGRGADNDVVLDDPEKGVSRAHAELRHEHGKYVLVDLGSQNGIFQDGARVERAVFRPNSAIVIGSFQLMIDETGGWPSGASDNAFSDATIVPPPGRLGYAPAEFEDPADSRALGPVGQDPKPGWMRANARSLMFGGGAVMLVSAIGLGAYMLKPPVLSDGEIDTHLVEAENLILQNQPRRAITDHLDKVLAVDPKNALAIELKEEAEDMIGQPPPPPNTELPPPPPPPPPPPRGGTRLDPRPPPDSTVPSEAVRPTVDPEVAAADRRANDAQAAIERGEITIAEELIRSLPPSHGRRTELQNAIGQRRRANADGFARQAADAARGGRLLEAIELYERTQKADPAYSVEPQLTDVRTRLRADADKKLALADVQYNFVNDAAARQEALTLYREALLMMKDHPRLAQVRERIKELGGK